MFLIDTLNGFKQLLNEKNQLKILSNEGDILNTVSTFNEPALEKRLEKLEEEYGIKLPPDYKQFLLTHDGACLFNQLDEGEVVIGGGFSLYSLEEIEKNENFDLFEEVEITGIPVGHLYTDCYLFIDPEKVKSGDRNYLIMLDFVDIRELNVNFEIFIERFLLSQGQAFWEWPEFTAINYY